MIIFAFGDSMPIPGKHPGLPSMPPNSQPANPTDGGTAASQYSWAL
ncbi:MAG TPA: hypothetical protein VK168_06445 [Saprospiraceae bacterium]|nr:hypothetical protein [Saprospiraceae bacterium]